MFLFSQKGVLDEEMSKLSSFYDSFKTFYDETYFVKGTYHIG